MFSKVSHRIGKQIKLTQMATQAFRATPVVAASKKPSIGDAVTILQSKVSQINQVVSCPQSAASALPGRERKQVSTIFVFVE